MTEYEDEELLQEPDFPRPGRTRTDGPALLAAIAHGDQQALEDFYNAYFTKLYRFVYYRVGRDHQHTEEVIHDTFVEAVEKAGRYDPSRGSVISWLITMSRNRIRSSNALMARPREHEKSMAAMEGEPESLFADTNRASSPQTLMEDEYLRDLVGTIMHAIPQEYSKLLEMKYVSNLSVRDISKAIHKTEKAVESQLTRARTAFREMFSAKAGMPAAELGL